MNILLVRPPRIKQAITLSSFMFAEPIGLEMIFEVLYKNHNVEIFDMMIENTSLTEKLIQFKADMVGITSLCIDVKMVLDLCEETKKVDNKILIMVGGTQAFLNPQSFISESVDYIFKYTNTANVIAVTKGEMNIPGILQKSEGFVDTKIPGRNEYMIPNRESTNKYRDQYSYFGYRPAAIIEYGIGCEKACDFCLRWRIEGFKEELIDRELFIKDILSIKEETIMLFDNDFFASREKLESFIEIIKKYDLKKNFIVYGSVEGTLLYKDLIAEFKELGLKAVLIGYETFNDDELVNYNKNTLSTDNVKASEILKELQIDVWASFMAHPDWTKEDFKSFRTHIKKLRPQISSINPLTPFPNLPMYNEYKDRLLYDVDDFEKWSFGQVIIRPLHMSLRSYYFELLKAYIDINLFINNSTEMIHKYGFKNIVRIVWGSLGASFKYIKLMIKN
jgi:radical SAM superfamily enzyme YgiQ (UPF0313 family)